MAPQDPGYAARQRQAVFRRRRLTVLLVACALAAVTSLATIGPSDAHIEGGQRVEASR